MCTKQVKVRYFAAAADAAGRTEETIELEDDHTLGHLSNVLAQRYGTRMAGIVGVAAFMQEGAITRDRSLTAASEVDIMPPYAGG